MSKFAPPNPGYLPRATEAALAGRKERIANLLQIDPNDQEWQQGHEARPPGSNLTAAQWMVEQRQRGSTRGRLVARIDLALEEIGGALYKYVLIWDAINRGPGIGAVRKALKSMATSPAPYVDGAREIDHVTLAWLDRHYPGGWIALETQPLLGPALQQAAQQALNDLPPPKKGRPMGRRDEAARALAQRLAQIYSSYAERNPTRRVDPQSHEYGPFKDFVAEAMSVLPDEYRTSAKGGLKGFDQIVRLAVDSMKRKRSKPRADRPGN